MLDLALSRRMTAAVLFSANWTLLSPVLLPLGPLSFLYSLHQHKSCLLIPPLRALPLTAVPASGR